MPEFIQREDGLLVPAHLMVPGAATVFCDESGNSGPNYLDAQQPFYVLGGWLVPDNMIVEIAVLIDEFRREHFQQADELKSSLILRNDRSKRLGASLIRQLIEKECLPIHLVAEKRFCIAGKIVETFLDPTYNELLQNAFTGDVETKVEIANSLYNEMDPESLNSFAQSYRSPSPKGLANSLRAVADSIAHDVSSALAQAVLGSSSKIDEIAEAESTHWLPNNVDATLNLPCLVSFLMLIENLARLGLAQPIHVIHDEQHTYEEGYKKIFEMHRGLPNLFARLPHTDVAYGQLQHVATFETRPSHESPIVQAADVIAGALGHIFKLALAGNLPDSADEELIDLLAPGFLIADPLMTWLVCSEHCLERIGGDMLKPSIRRLIPDIPVEQADKTLAALPTPMFPTKTCESRPSDRIMLDLPLFSIVAETTGQLFIFDNPVAAPAPSARFTILFSKREHAEEFLAMWSTEELSEPQRVIEFGVDEIPSLIGLLLDVNQWTKSLAFDPGVGGELQLTPINELAEGIRRAYARVIRLYVGGLDKVLTERVKIDGREALVMQASSGDFGAMIPPDGKLYFGASAEQAIQLLLKDQGNSSSP